MKQPRKRVARSIPDSGLEKRMRGLLDNFKAEVLEKFREQEEKNAEQDLKIAKQSEKISKLKETIAEQQKTIGARPDSGKTVRCCWIFNRKSDHCQLSSSSFYSLTLIILKICRR